MRHPGVDSRILSFAAADAPAHYPDLGPSALVDHERPAGVTGTRISGGLSGAQEVIDDTSGSGWTVLPFALSIRPNRNTDFLQDGRLSTTYNKKEVTS